MSRVGLRPINIPAGVTVKAEGRLVEIIGPRGSLQLTIRPEIKLKTTDQVILVERVNNTRQAKALHGLTRSLINNMVLGVTEGWQKTLEVQGTGYRAELKGDKLVLSVGFSYPVEVEPPAGIKFEVKEGNQIVIGGADKIQVGNLAAKIRKIKKPDAYKGKGIRYQGEVVKLKPGKAGKAGAAGAGGA